MNYLSLKAMVAFREHFEKKLNGFSVQVINHGELERVYILEDSLVLLVQFAIDTLPVCTNAIDFYAEYIDHPYLEFPIESGQYYDFVVEVYCSNQKVLNIPKSQAIRVDEENYVVLVDTKVIGTGRIKCKVTAQIPDADFSDSYRTEVVIIDTELDIIKHL